MDGLRATGPAGLARSAAAAGHGIINESDDIVANWRQELPGGDLHGSSKGILVNCPLPNRVPPLNVLPERGVMQRSERPFVGVPQMQAVLSSGSNTKGSDTNHAAVPAGPASGVEATTPVRWASAA